MTPERWPPRSQDRRRPNGRPLRVPPRALKELPVTDSRPVGPGPVTPVPESAADARAAALLALVVLAVVGALFAYSLDRWQEVGIPGKVAVAAIAGGAVFTLAIYAVSLFGYLVPTALGLRHRRERGPP